MYTKKINNSMSFLMELCGKKTEDYLIFKCKYDPVSIRFIEKSPQFVEFVLNNYLTPEEKKFAVVRFGLKTGKKIPQCYLTKKFSLTIAVMRLLEEKLLGKIYDVVNEYVDMCLGVGFKDHIIEQAVAKMGVDRYLDMYVKKDVINKIIFNLVPGKKVEHFCLEHICSLNLSGKIQKLLESLNINTIIELINLVCDDSCQEIPGMGKRYIETIEEAISAKIPNFEFYSGVTLDKISKLEINNNMYIPYIGDIDIKVLCLDNDVENHFKKKGIKNLASCFSVYTNLYDFTDDSIVDMKFTNMVSTECLDELEIKSLFQMRESLKSLLFLIWKLQKNKQRMTFFAVQGVGISNYIELYMKDKFISMAVKGTYEDLVINSKDSFENAKIQFKLKNVPAIQSFDGGYDESFSVKNLDLPNEVLEILSSYGIVNVLQLSKLISDNKLGYVEGLPEIEERKMVKKLYKRYPNHREYDKEDIILKNIYFNIVDEYDEALDHIDIWVLANNGLRHRVIRLLQENDILTLGQLINTYNEGFKNLKNLTPHSKYVEVKNALLSFFAV